MSAHDNAHACAVGRGSLAHTWTENGCAQSEREVSDQVDHWELLDDLWLQNSELPIGGWGIGVSLSQSPGWKSVHILMRIDSFDPERPETGQLRSKHPRIEGD